MQISQTLSKAEVLADIGLAATRFGVRPGSTVDNTVAMQAWAAELRNNGGVGILPPGDIYVSDEIDLYRPTLNIHIIGAGRRLTRVFSDFYGADKYLFKSFDPAYSARSGPLSFSDVAFWSRSRSGGIVPTSVGIGGWGESQFNNIYTGPSNNTVFRFSGCQNIRWSQVDSYYSGYFLTHKPTTGITFTVSGSTLTASASIFTSADVGKYFTVFTSDTIRHKYQISAVTDGTTATITGTTKANCTSKKGFFQGPVGSMTAGSNVLTCDSSLSIFSSDMVGMTLCVQKARYGWDNGYRILRAKILAVTNAYTVTLGDELGNALNADRSVTDVEFAIPTIEFFQSRLGSSGLTAGASDFKISQFRTEHYDGLGLFIENQAGLHMVCGKVHGETVPTSEAGSTGAMWLDDVAGTISIDLDSSASLSEGRIYCSNFNNVTRFEYVSTRNTINEKQFVVEEFGATEGRNGFVSVGTIEGYGTATAMSELYTDNNASERIDFETVNVPGIARRRPITTTRSDKGNSATLASAVVWNGTPPSGDVDKVYRWRQVGDIVYFMIRAEYATPGTTNTQVEITKPSDMPTPVYFTGTGTDDYIAAVQGFISTTGVAPALCKSTLVDDGGAVKFRVALNSSSVSAAFVLVQGWYFTDQNI